MEAEETADHTRRNALVALAVLATEEVVGSLAFIFEGRLWFLQSIPAVPLGALLTHWVLPFLIVYLVEMKDARSLGLAIRRRKLVRTPYTPSSAWPFLPLLSAQTRA